MNDLSPLPIRCLCGFVRMVTAATLAKGPRQPSSAIGMWTKTCLNCDPENGFNDWGWKLAGGREVEHGYGEDEIDRSNIASLARERIIRRTP